jgi:uroporphyrinogen decarboxylase
MNLQTAASITHSTDRFTSLERVLAVLQHREPDRVPHFEWVIDKGVIAALTNGGSYWDLVEALDIDAVMVAPAYRKQTIEDSLVLDEWSSVRTIGHDDYALVVEDRVPIKSEADLALWQVPDPDDPYRYEPIRRAVERFGGRRAIILQMRDVWSGVRDYMGYERALVNMIEQPDLVKAVVERCVDHYIRIIQRSAELGVNIVFSGDDIADARGPLFSPRLWQKLLLPHYRRLVNLYPFLDSIVDAGTDGIDPIDPMGGMELSVVKARYGDRVAIKGNVDQLELLAHGPAAAVVERVKACIRDAGTGGGYVCSSSNSIHSGVDPQLYRVMVDAIHRYGRYPLGAW